MDQAIEDKLKAENEMLRIKEGQRQGQHSDGETSADESKGGLFVHEVKIEHIPDITLTAPEPSAPQPSIEQDLEDLWSPEIARNKAGLAPDQFRMEGWKGGRAKTIIIGRGPENASSFRMERESAVGTVLEENRVPDITLGRFGEMKYNKKFMYGKSNNPIIQGVAWFTGGIDDPLSLLVPVPKPKTLQTTVDSKKKRLELAIKIKWVIEGVKVKSWETRTTIRRLWGLDTGDQYIYEAAKEQERRYAEWQKGERPALARSPTPGVVPAMEPDPNTINSLLKPRLDPVIIKPKTKSPMMEYKEMWCELNDIDTGDMEEQDQARFLQAWKMQAALG